MTRRVALGCCISRPDLSQSLWSVGIAPWHSTHTSRSSMRSVGFVAVRATRSASCHRRYGMMKKLVSIVEDDRFFRESMRRFIRSLGYASDSFPLAADFLASPRLAETACLIADVNMPGMTGIELYRHLIDTGRSIPTILVTGQPNDADRARALNDGVVCYLRKPVDEQDLIQCIRSTLTEAEQSS